MISTTSFYAVKRMALKSRRTSTGPTARDPFTCVIQMTILSSSPSRSFGGFDLMRPVILAACLAAFPISGNTQTSGIHSNQGGCDRLTGKPVSTDNVLILHSDRLEFWESSCPITQSQPVGSEAVLLTVTCSGEGETWDDFYMLETTSDPARVVLYPEDAPNARQDLQVCP